MAKGDRRRGQTQKRLMEALIAVSLEKSYDEVKIRDITNHARIAYSTFFRHFRDKDDLLLKMLEAVFQSLMDTNKENGDKSGTSKGRILFEHVLENHRFYHAMLNSQYANDILKPLQRLIAEYMPRIYPSASNSPIPVDLIVNHATISGLGMIKWWLDNDMPCSVADMGLAFDGLIVNALERLFLG